MQVPWPRIEPSHNSHPSTATHFGKRELCSPASEEAWLPGNATTQATTATQALQPTSAKENSAAQLLKKSGFQEMSTVSPQPAWGQGGSWAGPVGVGGAMSPHKSSAPPSHLLLQSVRSSQALPLRARSLVGWSSSPRELER